MKVAKTMPQDFVEWIGDVPSQSQEEMVKVVQCLLQKQIFGRARGPVAGRSG